MASYPHRPSSTATPVLSAMAQSVSLSSLMEISKQSQACLACIQTLLPPGLAGLVKAGPLDDQGWCLLVPHNAAGAKLRQLVPALSAHLRANKLPVEKIRVKVMSR
jgi:hypothetical protein